MYRLKRLFRELKHAWQRAIRGYDDVATWDYFSWFTNTSQKIISEMAKNHCGYPQGLTDEEWTNILTRLAFLLKEVDEDTCSVKNEYDTEEYYKLHEKWTTVKLEDGCTQLVSNYTEEDKELVDKFINREREIFEYRNKCKDEALDIIKQYFWNLWD